MFKNVLVVCVGNICRSPTAEYLLKAQLPGVQVSSAGLGALVGRGVESNAKDLLEKNGVECSEHSARQLDAGMLYQADVVVVMEENHIRGVLDIAPEVRGKVFLLGKWDEDREIPDPYRKSEEMFGHVYQLIARCVDQWVKVIR